jgi:uncharacterized membrane protein
MQTLNAPRTGKAHESNIEKVVRLEAEQDERIELAYRLSGAIGRFAGTNSFVVLQLASVALWFILNSGMVPNLTPFDPYPFALLALILALEAVLLTSFVLIRQNSMNEKADRRSHLELQVSLLAEKEATKIIQLLERLGRRMGIEDLVSDHETRELGKDTEVEEVARELQQNLKENTKQS